MTVGNHAGLLRCVIVVGDVFAMDSRMCDLYNGWLHAWLLRWMVACVTFTMGGCMCGFCDGWWHVGLLRWVVACVTFTMDGWMCDSCR